MITFEETAMALAKQILRAQDAEKRITELEAELAALKKEIAEKIAK